MQYKVSKFIKKCSLISYLIAPAALLLTDNPHQQAMQTAYHKALEVADKVPDSDLVIAADTVVEHEGIILEKPADFADACRVLASLSGHRHQVHTGVVLVLPKQRGALRVQKFSETTHVEFAPLSTALIEAYVKTGDPFDKAGSYGIQGPAGAFVRGIEGCYFNVMGLPMHRLSQEVAHLLREGLI